MVVRDWAVINSGPLKLVAFNVATSGQSTVLGLIYTRAHTGFKCNVKAENNESISPVGYSVSEGAEPLC